MMVMLSIWVYQLCEGRLKAGEIGDIDRGREGRVGYTGRNRQVCFHHSGTTFMQLVWLIISCWEGSSSSAIKKGRNIHIARKTVKPTSFSE